MKKYIIYITIIALTGATTSYFFIKNNAKTTNTEVQMEQTPMPSSTHFVLKAKVAENNLKIPAEIVADQSAEIYAKVLSYVTAVRVDIGSKVSKGQVLLELDAPEITAQLSSLTSKIVHLEAQAKLSQANYDRIVKASQSQGAVSQLAIDEAQTKWETDKALLDAMKADYEQAKSMHDYLVIRAPFSGIITKRKVDIGNMVGPSNNGQKEALLVLQDNRNLRIRLSVSEKYASQVYLNDTLNFTVRSLPTKNFEAKLTRKSGALDTHLRSQLFEADYVNTDNLLLPGMVADATVQLHNKTATFWVPKMAVSTSPNGAIVIVANNNTTETIPVKVLQEKGMQLEITGNLSEGDTLTMRSMM